MANKLTINIADIVFSLISEKEIYRSKDNAPYQLFFTEGNAEVVLRFRTGAPIQGKKNLPGEILFDTQLIWRLYYSNKKYIFQTRDSTAILTPDFTSGEFYIPKTPRRFPFTYPLDELLMISLLSKKRGMMAHAFGLKDNRKGMLFAGESGAGKSTLSNLWKDKKHATVLSDDRIIIRKMEGRFWIYGTPWHGEADLCSQERAPLEKIFFLRHAKKNKSKKITPMEAASRLMVCSFPTFWDKKGMEFTLKFIDELVTEVPCYELNFLPDKKVIDFARNI